MGCNESGTRPQPAGPQRAAVFVVPTYVVPCGTLWYLLIASPYLST